MVTYVSKHIPNLSQITSPLRESLKHEKACHSFTVTKQLVQTIEIQKFHYLRASLGGTAAQVIHSIEFSAENYIIAWELLCQRYNNTTLLVNNHVQGLFSLPNLTKESSLLCQRYNNTTLLVNNHVQGLFSLPNLTKESSAYRLCIGTWVV
ncbi:Protein of unknown function (DUF1759) [Popillia japonica]|uniref:Uncharacterized protein n=1 Tax=Popillia japonica TaxID=7064 RepID=A0AAW1JI08_POPJA